MLDKVAKCFLCERTFYVCYMIVQACGHVTTCQQCWHYGCIREEVQNIDEYSQQCPNCQTRSKSVLSWDELDPNWLLPLTTGLDFVRISSSGDSETAGNMVIDDEDYCSDNVAETEAGK